MFWCWQISALDSCLGDVLRDYGYRNVFMGGASPVFAGKETFLRTHGYHEVHGKEDWLARGYSAGDMNGWGLFDGDLFAHAKTKFLELQQSGKPFNLTILTVDTHEPDGFVSKNCSMRGDNSFEGIVLCTAADMARFVRFIEDSGYLDNTNVVVMGDHLARKNPVWDKLSTESERYIYNTFISTDAWRKARDELVHFDLFPTLLEFAGIEIPQGRLGLDYSAFKATAPLPADDRFAEMQKALLRPSSRYTELWANRRQM